MSYWIWRLNTVNTWLASGFPVRETKWPMMLFNDILRRNVYLEVKRFMSLFELCWFYDAYGIITEGVQWAFGNTIMELTRSNGVGHTDSTAVNVNVVVVAWKCMVLFRQDTQELWQNLTWKLQEICQYFHLFFLLFSILCITCNRELILTNRIGLNYPKNRKFSVVTLHLSVSNYF